MKKILWFSLVAVLGSATSGCIDFLDEWDADHGYDEPASAYEPYDYADDYGTEVVIDDGYMAGDLGTYRAFVAPSYETSGLTYGDNTTVELNGGTDYWVMTRFEIQGSLQHRDLVPGAHLEFDNSSYSWDYDASAGTQLYISAIGCSGPTQGDWAYDASADRIVVDVEEGATPNDRVIFFQAEYDNYGETQVVDGSFGYAVY